MSKTDARCSSALCSSRAVVTVPTRRATVSPNRGASRTPVGCEKSALALFIMFAALLAIGADAPPEALDPASSRTRIVVSRTGPLLPLENVSWDQLARPNGSTRRAAARTNRPSWFGAFLATFWVWSSPEAIHAGWRAINTGRFGNFPAIRNA
jgi:hypothetical protein